MLVAGRLLPLQAWRALLASQQRERSRLLGEMAQVRGLMPLLMKRRNGHRWSRDEKNHLRQQLGALAHLSPYVAVMVLPGSFVVIPILAWWLDRRRIQRSQPGS